MESNCCCAPQQPCPACGYCPCCGRGRQIVYPYQPWQPYPGPIWIGDPYQYTGGYVHPTYTGMPITTTNTTITS
jgi:hypothetical protein